MLDEYECREDGVYVFHLDRGNSDLPDAVAGSELYDTIGTVMQDQLDAFAVSDGKTDDEEMYLLTAVEDESYSGWGAAFRYPDAVQFFVPDQTECEEFYGVPGEQTGISQMWHEYNRSEKLLDDLVSDIYDELET